MDRPERLGEARCEISRGGQAKGGGAVFEEIRWDSLHPLSTLDRPPGPQLWSRPDCCRGTKPAGRLGGPGGLVAFGFLPPGVPVPRGGAMLRNGTHCAKVVVAGLQEEPTRFAQEQGAQGVTHKWSLLSWDRAQSGFPRLASGLLDNWTGRQVLCRRTIPSGRPGIAYAVPERPCVWRHWCCYHVSLHRLDQMSTT